MQVPTHQYTLKRSKRARHINLRVLPGGEVVLTAPVFAHARTIERFVGQHSTWIAKTVRRMQKCIALPVSGRRAYLKHKEEARAFITARVEHWNEHYRYPCGRIAIKDTKRSWGSCSSKGNLNFSYMLLFLPQELADYVIVHELCHLKEQNHSPRFWALVEQMQPNHRHLRKELRRYVLR